jgi:putative ABC transport system permease protein
MFFSPSASSASLPVFAVVAVLTLAFGIGANTAIFSLVDTALLRSLPYRESDRLVYLYQDSRSTGFPRQDFPPANYLDCKTQVPVFEDVAAVDGNTFNLSGAGEPERLWGVMPTWNLFPMGERA